MAAIDHFNSNLGYVRNLLALARAVDATTTSAVDVGDIQRAAIVMVVSALDHFVHERVREGMLDALRGTRPRTAAFLRFEMSMSAVLEGQAPGAGTDWFEEAIRDKHGHRPFLKVEDIADALRLVSGVELWTTVASQTGHAGPQALKADIKVIVDRRNKIAHEADLNPTQPGLRWPISDGLATGAVDTIEAVVNGIEACV